MKILSTIYYHRYTTSQNKNDNYFTIQNQNQAVSTLNTTKTRKNKEGEP
jgi:hypothetical protein